MESEVVELTLDTVTINDISLPFKIRPREEYSDALDDFFIRTSEWFNYISEVLLFSHVGSKMPISDFSVKPQIKGPRRRRSSASEDLPTPKITIKDKNLDAISRNLSRNLFHHSISQLVTNFEVFLNEITEELLWRNVALLSTEQKQLTNKEIFELGDIDEIKTSLIQTKVMEHAMSAYPKRVDSFQKLFHIGVHSKKSPIELPVVQDLMEVRNVIQHNDGHCSPNTLLEWDTMMRQSTRDY
ncbi:hypothetical protein [Shewanella woodyi]|uniref:hypothetical protein n=1 Tax=Shewanella woodyi TaxID=60961 RepID=UPI0037489409